MWAWAYDLALVHALDSSCRCTLHARGGVSQQMPALSIVRQGHMCIAIPHAH